MAPRRAASFPTPTVTCSRSANTVADSTNGGPMLGDNIVFPILLSKDLDASRHFYRDVLGLELAREDAGNRLVFRSATTQLVITRSSTGTRDTQTQCAWRVADIHAAV